MIHDENAPAFPACNEANVNDTTGMTMRDWFASQALVGMGNWWPTHPQDFTAKAVWAYSMADAMLKVRVGEHLHREGRNND